MAATRHEHHPQTIRRLWQLTEPLHAVCYFSPEPVQALRDSGFRGYWMGYFAQRSAPLGAVPPEVVEALFFNFSAEHVRASLPAAWDFAAPAAALEARLTGSVAALRRILGEEADPDDIARVADLLGRAVAETSRAGHALFAANAALPTPEDPLGALWQATTSLREHRGDGHIAVLVAEGLTGSQAHVLQSLTSTIPRETFRYARKLEDDAWADALGALHDSGLVDDAGRITDAGTRLKAHIEARTDALAGTAYASLSPDDVSEVLTLTQPWARAVVASGEIPAQSPMGLDLADI